MTDFNFKLHEPISVTITKRVLELSLNEIADDVKRVERNHFSKCTLFEKKRFVSPKLNSKGLFKSPLKKLLMRSYPHDLKKNEWYFAPSVLTYSEYMFFLPLHTFGADDKGTVRSIKS